MSSDRKTRASFVMLNRAEQPDPEFAARLRERVLGEVPADARPARVVPFRQPASTAPAARKRTRWLDIAAAAVLLVGIVSGMASLAPNRANNGLATIQAPETAQPVMPGGTAAQGNQYPGPAPTPLDYERQWGLAGEHRDYAWPALVYGELVYAVGTTYADMLQSTVEAIDLETGEVVWRQTTHLSASFAVSPRGVVAFVPAIDADTPIPGPGASSAGTGAVRVVLLDLQTGEPIWLSEGVYPGQALAGLQPIVSAESIYFADGNGAIAALALSTGAERWRHEYERTLAPGLDPQICRPVEGQGVGCASRWDYSVKVAASDALVYFSDMVTARVTALSLTDGSERWSVSMIDRAGSATHHGALIAREDGVIVQIFGPEAAPDEGGYYLGLWNAEDGAEIWWNSFGIPFNSIASDGLSLFVTYAWAGETCCFLSAIDARTGEFLWTKTLEADAYVIGFLPSANMILLSVWTPLTATIGIDAETRQEVWRFRHFQNDCAPILPLADDGSLVCWGFSSGLNVFQPATIEAQPEAAASPAAGYAISADGAAAQDGQRPGQFPPADAAYELLWQDSPESDRRVGGWWPHIFGDVIYSTVSVGRGEELRARDLQTGNTLWRTPTVSSFDISVTAAGVVVALPVADAAEGSPEPFTLALLDHASGTILWETDREYQHDGVLGFSVVDKRSVMFVDESRTVAAIDLSNGSERWRYEGIQGRTEAEMLGECAPLSQSCGDRSSASSRLALWGDMLYVYLPMSTQVVALSAQDGSQRWAVSVPERTGQLSSALWLIATELGVVVSAANVQPDGSVAAEQYVGHWKNGDGAEVWAREELAALIVRAGSSLVVASEALLEDAEPSCCTLRELDLATGAVIHERPTDGGWPWAYFPESDVLLVLRFGGVGDGIIRNLRADDNGRIDPVPIPNCGGGLLPTEDGRYVLCDGSDLILSVYRVSDGSATPTP